MVTPTVISTFAGCGGSSLGYKMAGFKELLAVEWDTNAVDTFKLNFPEVPVFHGDIAKLSVDECLKLTKIKPGELDVLDGSPPCQGFSAAGKRKMSDPRNSLFKEYVRLLKGLQPKVFVMENVSGMIKGYMKQVFLIVTKELRACGYDVAGQVMNAMYYGVPQMRQRVILIGVRNDLNLKASHPKPKTKPISIATALKGTKKELVPPLTAYYQPIAEKVKQGQCADDVIKGKGFQNCVRPYWHKPCPTIPKIVGSAGYGTFIHPLETRMFTIAELKRLQSFPDDFKFVGKYTDVRARIGNSVPPLLMKAIAEHTKEKILWKKTNELPSV